MEERRKIDRVSFKSQSVLVVCDTEETINAEVINMSPLGMAIKVPAGSEKLLKKDVIIVTETLIMYALVVRSEKLEDGVLLGIEAKKFTNDVLQYLFSHIGLKDE